MAAWNRPGGFFGTTVGGCATGLGLFAFIAVLAVSPIPVKVLGVLLAVGAVAGSAALRNPNSHPALVTAIRFAAGLVSLGAGAAVALIVREALGPRGVQGFGSSPMGQVVGNLLVAIFALALGAVSIVFFKVATVGRRRARRSVEWAGAPNWPMQRESATSTAPATGAGPPPLPAAGHPARSRRKLEPAPDSLSGTPEPAAADAPVPEPEPAANVASEPKSPRSSSLAPKALPAPEPAADEELPLDPDAGQDRVASLLDRAELATANGLPDARVFLSSSLSRPLSDLATLLFESAQTPPADRRGKLVPLGRGAGLFGLRPTDPARLTDERVWSSMESLLEADRKIQLRIGTALFEFARELGVEGADRWLGLVDRDRAA